MLRWCSVNMLQELAKERPSIKLLYVTPEQLVASRALEDALGSLRQRHLLARFVVDEARLAGFCICMQVDLHMLRRGHCVPLHRTVDLLRGIVIDSMLCNSILINILKNNK